jgi:very-short-patch-repair endonuclease
MRARFSVRPRFASLLAERAHALRQFPSVPEATLWRELSGAKCGAVFRRQVPLGRYIVDFVALHQRLVVEVDGSQHRQRRAADARRDRALARLGYRVLRLEAELVMRNLPEAVARVRAALAV